MIVGVFGPRDVRGADGKKGVTYSNYSYIAGCLEEYDASAIVSGGGVGVEQLALRYATSKGIEPRVIPPDLNQHGHDAWPIRNKEILSIVDVAVLFWDGRDRFYYPLLEAAIEQQVLLHLRHVE